MKQGWKYLPIGEVADVTDFVANGSFATLRDNVQYHTEPSYAVLVRVVDFSSDFDKTKFVYVDKRGYDFLEKSSLQGGEIIMSNVGSIGKEFICPDLGMPMTLGPNAIVIRTDNNKYYYYCFFSDWFQNLLKGISGRGGLIKFNKTNFKQLVVPVPPKDIQDKIVEELDQINALIAIKEKQLRELEELEQTIFHEMFGDPIDNEKGWNVDLLSNLCEVFAGGDKPKNLSDMQSKEFPYPVIANGDGGKGILGYSNSCRVKEDAVTIGARGASIGNCRIVKNGFTPAIRLITLVPKEKLNCYFLYFFVRNMDYRINGVAQAQLTVPNIEKENILVPPIALQLHFAEKMQEIEILKDNLSTVKRDLEELLASRMQYWFD